MRRIALSLPLILSLLFAAAGLGLAQGLPVQLAGRPTATNAAFEFVQNFNDVEIVSARIDGGALGLTLPAVVDVWVVAARDGLAWAQDATLVDVRAAGAEALAITSPTAAIVTLAMPGDLSSAAGDGLGVGYDVVVDVDRDGVLTHGDLIDGGGSRPGFWVVHDTTLPGPHSVALATYGGGPFLGQRTHYPTDIAMSGQVPLVVISHGWTYTEVYYDYIAQHLASYGYIVMAHQSDVGNGDAPGTLTAATSLIANIDYLLGHLGTIAGGALAGHVDSSRIMFIGHSTGGEAVVRAAHMLRQQTVAPVYFRYPDLRIVSSIAPVSWHPRTVVDPADLNYHLFVAGADTDVSGGPFTAYQQCFSIYERATGNRHATYVHGAGHGDFLGCCGALFLDTAAPALIGRPATNTVARGYYLPLAELYLRDNPAAEEFFTRPYASFHPAGIAANVTVTNESRDRRRGHVVLDDFESAPSLAQTSSGGAVTFSVANITEILMQDNDGFFSWPPVQPSNGMTRAMHPGDDPHCVVMDWNHAGHWTTSVVPAARDFGGHEFLSFRACQGTRHPETVGLGGPLFFGLRLTDGSGGAATMSGVGNVPPPYARVGSGVGPGAGWQNEFTTIRVRLTDFLLIDPTLDLSDIVSVRFVLDASVGSERGRMGLDDLELVPFAEVSNGTAIAAGNVGVGEGGPFDVLLIDGSAGGPLRRFDLAAGVSAQLLVQQPASSPAPVPFALAGHIGLLNAADVTALPFSIGSMIFAPPAVLPQPETLLIASSLGFGAAGLIPATLTPWAVTIPPVAIGGWDMAFQGVLVDDSGAFQVTNALLLRVD